MNQILLLTVLCFASASCLKLENICSSHIFRYQDVQVNSFHRIKLNLKFESLEHYLINDKQNFWEALKIKHDQ